MAPCHDVGGLASLERFTAGNLVQQLAAMLRVQFAAKELLANLPQFFDPTRVHRRELSFEFATQPLRKRGTFSGSRNRNLQISTAYHCRVIEVAAVGIVHYVAQNLPALRFAIDRVVDLERRGGRYHQEGRMEVCGFELTWLPCE